MGPCPHGCTPSSTRLSADCGRAAKASLAVIVRSASAMPLAAVAMLTPLATSSSHLVHERTAFVGARKTCSLGALMRHAQCCARELVQSKPYVQADGSLRPTSVEAEALLQEALALDAGQALALHLHVHLSEAASPLRCV